MPSHIGVMLPLMLIYAGTVTQGYNDGDHGNPASKSFDKVLYYSMDIAVGEGTPVVAEGAGTVVSVLKTLDRGDKGNHGYGNLITIRYDDGYYGTYLHLAKETSKYQLRPPNRVKLGQTLGQVGMTGATFGPHIHTTYGQNLISEGTLSGVKNDPYGSILVADGSKDRNDGPPVYFFATSNGLPPQDGQLIYGDNASAIFQVPPRVQTVSQMGRYYQSIPLQNLGGARRANAMAGWFFGSDPNGGVVREWLLYDATASSTSGHFTVSTGYYYSGIRRVFFKGAVPANKVVYVTPDAIKNASFVGGSNANALDYVYVAAGNGTSASDWQEMGVYTDASKH